MYIFQMHTNIEISPRRPDFVTKNDIVFKVITDTHNAIFSAVTNLYITLSNMIIKSNAYLYLNA